MDQSSFTFLLIYDICCKSLDEGSSALASNEVPRDAASSLDLLGLKLPAMTDRVSQLHKWGDARYANVCSIHKHLLHFNFCKVHLGTVDTQILKGI